MECALVFMECGMCVAVCLYVVCCCVGWQCFCLSVFCGFGCIDVCFSVMFALWLWVLSSICK